VIASIEPERCRSLNDVSQRAGDYVLYWMQSSHRTEENPALRYAVERADRAHLPLIVYFGLWQAYPESNLRHFRFMLEGLADVARSLETLGIRFVLMTEPPDRGVVALAKNAAVVVVDRGYLRLQRSWYRAVAERCRCPLVQVEGNVVVPVEAASQKEEYSAATFRPRSIGSWTGSCVPWKRWVRSVPPSPSIFPRSQARKSTHSSPALPSTVLFPHRTCSPAGRQRRTSGSSSSCRLDSKGSPTTAMIPAAAGVRR